LPQVSKKREVRMEVEGSGMAVVVPMMRPGSDMVVDALLVDVRIPPLFSISIQAKCRNSMGFSGLISRAMKVDPPSGMSKLTTGSPKLLAINPEVGMLLIPNEEKLGTW